MKGTNWILKVEARFELKKQVLNISLSLSLSHFHAIHTHTHTQNLKSCQEEGEQGEKGGKEEGGEGGEGSKLALLTISSSFFDIIVHFLQY